MSACIDTLDNLLSRTSIRVRANARPVQLTKGAQVVFDLKPLRLGFVEERVSFECISWLVFASLYFHDKPTLIVSQRY